MIVAIVAAVGTGTISSEAAVPTAPLVITDTTVLFDSNRDPDGNYELYAGELIGGVVATAVQLTDDPQWDSWWPQISPDRNKILFYRVPKGVHDTDYTKTQLWMMSTNDLVPYEVLPVGANGWNQHGHAEWSPNGQQLVMFGGPFGNPQIFIADVVVGANGRVTLSTFRQVTNRGIFSIDPNWSPNGDSIVYIACAQVGCRSTKYEVYVVPSAQGANPKGSAERKLTSDNQRANDPVFSPQGDKIAWMQTTGASPSGGVVWSILSKNADGSGGILNVTSDQGVNAVPQWSADGSKIYYHRFTANSGPSSSEIYSVPSGGGPKTLVASSLPSSTEYVAIP